MRGRGGATPSVLILFGLRHLYMGVVYLSAVGMVVFLSGGRWALESTGILNIGVLGGIGPRLWAKCVDVGPDSFFGPSS